jgi:FAD synthase
VGPTDTQDVIVALGKFDALHRGHRALAEKAALLGGHPFLLSFSGMAEVLGWPIRKPLVPLCDRPRVLSSWQAACMDRCPRQRFIPFHEIRTMSPEDFVRVLAEDLKAKGVVAGSNYRFGERPGGFGQGENNERGLPSSRAYVSSGLSCTTFLVVPPSLPPSMHNP